MSNKYGYLKKYINNKEKWPSNIFQEIRLESINEYEKKLGLQFPRQLKDFWQEIGCGFLVASDEAIGLSTFDHDNRILPPEDIESIILLKEGSDLILPEYAEYLEDGDMPFFSIADSSSFLVMKPKSDNPNAVYDMAGNKIEDSFERFIHRLYYESPTYYLHVNDDKPGTSES